MSVAVMIYDFTVPAELCPATTYQSHISTLDIALNNTGLASFPLAECIFAPLMLLYSLRTPTLGTAFRGL